MKWSDIKSKLPRIHAYQHTSGISITPEISYQWYKYHGKSSEGCLKRQIRIGWFIWSIQFLWDHPKKVAIIKEFKMTEISLMPDGSHAIGGIIKSIE